MQVCISNNRHDGGRNIQEVDAEKTPRLLALHCVKEDLNKKPKQVDDEEDSLATTMYSCRESQASKRGIEDTANPHSSSISH